MARMLGAVRPSWCPICRTPPGPDCPDTARSRRQQRRAEARQVHRLITTTREDTETDA